MVVRNPICNISQPEPLQLACFVAMMMVLQKRRIEAERRYIYDDTQKDGKLKVRYNILGQHSMDINGQRIREQDLAHPNRRGWVILLYLILHKTPVDQLSMAAELWQTRPKQKFFSMTGIESLTRIARKMEVLFCTVMKACLDFDCPGRLSLFSGLNIRTAFSECFRELR